jgi:hypothetical protein
MDGAVRGVDGVIVSPDVLSYWVLPDFLDENEAQVTETEPSWEQAGGVLETA